MLAQPCCFGTLATLYVLRWAVGTVMTRQNQLPDGDTGSMLALIPLWDLMNHKAGQVASILVR